MSQSESAKLMAVLSAAYPRQQITEKTIEAYAEFLADLDYEDCQRAASAIIRTSAFFPTVAEIRRQVQQDTDPLGFYRVFGADTDRRRLDDDVVLRLLPGERA